LAIEDLLKSARVETVKGNTDAGKLLCWQGERSKLMTPELMERMAGEYGGEYGGEFVMIEGVHNVMKDHGWEESAEK
jgi:hypothetical protein